MAAIRIRGFTIVEFLTVLVIAGVFLALAVPGYYQMIQNNKTVTATNRLAASFHFARIEAVKRGVPVIVCPAGNASFTACGNNTQWSQGWIIFTDADGNNNIDNQSDLMKVTEDTAAGVSISSLSDRVSYNGVGFVTSGNVQLTIRAQGCTGNSARIISISSSGRLSITPAAC